MAQETKTPPNAAAANADIANQLAEQDINGHSTAPDPAGDAGTALDALAKQVTEAHEAATGPTGPAEPPLVTAAAGATGPTGPAESGATGPTAGATGPDENQLSKAQDIFKDSPSLPTGASPKSSEAFAAVKLRAAQEIAAREAQLEKIREELKAAKEAAGQPSPEQQAKEKELEEHRAWRAKIDVEFDPKFKEFDKTVESSREFIYAQLRKSPVVTEEVIAQIKKFGGPDATNMTELFKAMGDPTVQRVIESKISDILMQKYAKEQAMTAAKTNLSDYLQQRETEAKGLATSHVTHTKAALDTMLQKLAWFAEKKIEAGAPEADRKQAESHNQFVSELKGQLDAALADDSPQMRAILLTGMAQLFHTQRAQEGLKAELASTKAELETVKAKWNKIVNSSRSRLSESGAASGGNPPPPPKSNQFTTPAADALDAIAKQVMEERERKAAGATV
jgi:hypothetical protein